MTDEVAALQSWNGDVMDRPALTPSRSRGTFYVGQAGIALFVMKPPVLTALALVAMLSGCGTEDGAHSNLSSARENGDEILAPVVYEAGAFDTPSEIPPKEAPRLKRLIPVRMGRYVEWTFESHPEPVGYRMGDITVIVRGAGDGPITRQVRVKAPGRAEYVLETETGARYPTLLGYGRFDRAGTPYLLMQTETGGNHCCGELELFILHPKRIEHVELAMSASYGTPDARDVDGDGLVDFIVSDRSFLNRFTGWASGREPPKILNVVGGEVRDVSARPGFRSVFRNAARELREDCLHPGGDEPNSACAAYVAAAGRAGNFKRAWAEMLKAHDRSSKEGLECRLHMPDDACPPEHLKYATYPDALRAFLLEQGFPAA